MTVSHKIRRTVFPRDISSLNLIDFTNEIGSNLRCDLVTVILRVAKKRVRTGLPHYRLAQSGPKCYPKGS